MAAEEASRTASQRQGDFGERLVSEQLTASGWQILATKLRVGRSEIDLLAVDPGPPRAIVLVEVRWRGSRDYGLPEETLDWRKRRTLRAALARLIASGRLPGGMALPALPARIDLVAVEPPTTHGGRIRFRHHRSAIGG